MSSELGIRYVVRVEGLDAATSALNNAQRSAGQTTETLNQLRASSQETSRIMEEASRSQANLMDVSRSTLSVSMTLIREVNAARLAIVQAHRALTEMDPVAALYAFLNLVQVANTLIPLMKSLQAVAQGTAVAQGIIATLSGMGWMVPIAIAAGAAILAAIQLAGRSKQSGGYVEGTGIYLLHKGEYVVPAESVVEKRVAYPISPVTNIRYGPFYVTLHTSKEEFDPREFVREYGEEIARRARRMGL